MSSNNSRYVVEYRFQPVFSGIEPCSRNMLCALGEDGWRLSGISDNGKCCILTREVQRPSVYLVNEGDAAIDATNGNIFISKGIIEGPTGNHICTASAILHPDGTLDINENGIVFGSQYVIKASIYDEDMIKDAINRKDTSSDVLNEKTSPKEPAVKKHDACGVAEYIREKTWFGEFEEARRSLCRKTGYPEDLEEFAKIYKDETINIVIFTSGIKNMEEWILRAAEFKSWYDEHMPR